MSGGLSSPISAQTEQSQQAQPFTLRIQSSLKYDFCSFLNAISDDPVFSRGYEDQKQAWLPAIRNNPAAWQSFKIWQGHGIPLAYLLSVSSEPWPQVIAELRNPEHFDSEVEKSLDEPAYRKEFEFLKENRESLLSLMEYFQKAGFEQYWDGRIQGLLLQRIASFEKEMSMLNVPLLRRLIARFSSDQTNPRGVLPEVYATYFSRPYNFTLTRGSICLRSDLDPSEAPAAVLHEWLHQFNPASDVLGLQEGIRRDNPFYRRAWGKIYEGGKEGREEEFVIAAELYISVLTGIRTEREALRYIKNTYRGLPLAGLIYDRLHSVYPAGLPVEFDYGHFLGDVLKSDVFTAASMQNAYLRLIGPVSGSAGMRLELSTQGPIVVQVFDGFPASLAGIEIGDVLVEANGSSLNGLPLPKVLDIVSGRPGDAIDLVVLKKGRRRIKLT